MELFGWLSGQGNTLEATAQTDDQPHQHHPPQRRAGAPRRDRADRAGASGSAPVGEAATARCAATGVCLSHAELSRLGARLGDPERHRGPALSGW